MNTSVENQTFSSKEYVGGYPSPIKGETYREYRERINKLVTKGFHLGDLSFNDWGYYCMGSGFYEGVDCEDIIL